MKVIPCKRPKIEVVQHVDDPAFVSVFCRVPGCEWKYGTPPYKACKSDAEEQAKHHRRHHREAVPSITISRENGHPYRVACSCGHVRCDGATTTRGQAEGVRDFHLFDDHGLVSCS